MLNKSNNLPSHFNMSLIKLISKNKKKEKEIRDYRPISLTNYDYRIFTKLLTNRLRFFNDYVFKNNQFCSIYDKKIDDIIHLVKDLIADSNIKDKKLYITLIDQAKAFDSISHQYLFKILKRINIGNKLYDNIVKIYSFSNTRIWINDNLTKEI